VNNAAWAIADKARGEYVIKVTGTVGARPEGLANAKLATGDIEVTITSAEILTESKTTPFEIVEQCEANEDIRLKYRYLDLRRRKVLENVEFRSAMTMFTRKWFSEHGFLEVQTPIFTVSSPEGARDYLIPSRIQPGKFYALPQAPQQYKQLLMVGGIDKYFQIAPCFRDEDPRADRHSCEFYQIDVEMSFVEQEDVFKIAEGYVKDLIPALSPHKHIKDNKVYRLTHSQAMDMYGSDKPDIRFDMKFVDLTKDFANSEFSVFRDAVASGGTVKAMKLSGKTMSRSEIDEITEVAKSAGAKGLAYIIYEAEGARSPILKFFKEEVEIKAINEKLNPQVGDMVFFAAGEYERSCKILGTVRVALRDKYTLADQNELAFTWVTDFPMFEVDEATGKIDFGHNPFSWPQGGMDALENKKPEEIFAAQYDLALNGFEILSGGIRNHDPRVMLKAFGMVGKGEAEVKEKFGAMYNAFQYGAPPHGGFAFGFDRLLMILKDEPNIREVYAFPKSGRAEDTMMSAPSYVDDAQLGELHIDLLPEARMEMEKRKNQQ
jgi:aspartyl-tRNA synthetase